jgi:uncharacterized membrane protein
VVWIGGITINLLVLLPSIRETLEPLSAGKLMGAVMKRFRRLVYASIFVLGVTGVLMNLLDENYLGLMKLGNLWSQITLIKHVFTVALIILAVYAFEGLGPKVSRLAAKGPSPDLVHLQKFQIKLATSGLIMGMIILLSTGIITAIS